MRCMRHRRTLLHSIGLAVTTLGVMLWVLPTASASAACAPLPTNEGNASFTVSVPASGTYRVWLHEFAPTANDNGFYMQIDNSYCNVRVGDSSSIPAGQFTWIDYQNATASNVINVSLGAGSHTVTLAGLDPGVGVDKMLFLTDQSCVPTGVGSNCETAATTTPPPAPGQSGTSTTIVPMASGGSTGSVSGTITLPAAPSGTTRTYYLDGKPVIGSKIDTSVLSDGTHTLQVVQKDANGKVEVLTQKLTVRNHQSFWSRLAAFVKRPIVAIPLGILMALLVAGVVLRLFWPLVFRRYLARLKRFFHIEGASADVKKVVYSGDIRPPVSRSRMIVFGVSFAVICGGAVWYALAANGIAVSYVLSGASVSNGAVIATNGAAIGGKMVQFESAASAPAPAPTPTPTPTPVPTPTPSGGVPAVGSYVKPGTVGYLGAVSALTVYQTGGATPSGCSWQSYGLRCDQTDLALDHVYIKGGLYWTGGGSLTITNSIVEGSASWYAVYAAAATNDSNAVIKVTDSTLRWQAGFTEPSGQDVGPIWTRGTQAFDVERCDLSGMPQGMDPGADSIIKDNWIHDLNQNSPGGTPSHIDGVYSQGGGNILVEGNYIDVPTRSDTTAALFIQDRGATDTGIKIYANYLSGGAYTLRNQTGIGVDVENNTFGSSLYGTVGDLTGYPGTYGTWSGNILSNGSPLSAP